MARPFLPVNSVPNSSWRGRQWSAGDAAKQICRRSPEPPDGRAGRAAGILAAVLELPEQPGPIQLSESPACSPPKHSPAASLSGTGELKFPWKKKKRVADVVIELGMIVLDD